MPIEPTHVPVNQPRTSASAAGDAISNSGSYAHRNAQQADVKRHLCDSSTASSSEPVKRTKLSSGLVGTKGRPQIKDSDPLKQSEAFTSVKALATQKNKRYKRQVIMAARQGDLITLKRLVEASDTDILLVSDSLGSTPLYYATAGGHDDCVSYILGQLNSDQLRVLAKQKAGYGEPIPVVLAASRGHLLILKAMVKAFGTSILLSENNYNATPLLQAVKEDKTECVDYILQQVGKDQAKALINHIGYSSESLAAIAAYNGNLAILKRCVEFGDSDTFLKKNGYELTALHRALQNRHERCLDYMLSQLSKTQMQNFCEQSNENLALYAIEYADLKTLKTLVNIFGKSILLEDGKIRKRLIAKAINNKRKEILAYLLTFNELQKQLSDINFFDSLMSIGAIHSPDYLSLLEKSTKATACRKNTLASF